MKATEDVKESMVVGIERSKEWCLKRALDTGESVPQRVNVTVSPAALSKDCRAALLRLSNVSSGCYPNQLWSIGYSSTGELYAGYCGWGSVDIAFDADADDFSNEALSAAILTAIHKAGATARKIESRKEVLEEIAELEQEIANLRAAIDKLRASLD